MDLENVDDHLEILDAIREEEEEDEVGEDEGEVAKEDHPVITLALREALFSLLQTLTK